MLLPSQQAVVRAGHPVRLVRQDERPGKAPEVTTALPGSRFGILRSVGQRWLIFRLDVHAIPAGQLLRPSLYSRGQDGLWTSTAPIHLPFMLMADGAPRPTPLAVGQVVRPGLQPFWPAHQPAIQTQEAVVFLAWLTRSDMAGAGVDSEDMAFFSPGRLWVVDPANFDFDTGAPVVSGQRRLPAPRIAVHGPVPSGWPLRTACR